MSVWIETPNHGSRPMDGLRAREWRELDESTQSARVHSGSFPVVVLQEAAEPFLTENATSNPERWWSIAARW